MSNLAPEYMAALDRDPDAVTAYRFADGRLLELTPDEYREQAAARAREWNRTKSSSDPGSVLGYKPDWAKPESR